MSKDIPKLQSWQIFHAANKHLTPGGVAKIFGKKGERTAYSYGQDPACTQHRSRDPLECSFLMLERLDEVGRGDVARAAISFLSGAFEDGYQPPIEEMQPTLELELLKDFGAVANMQTAIENDESVDAVGECCRAAVEEIERTYAKYVEVKKKRGSE